MVKTIELNFDGYWPESRIKGIPNNSGVYLVYRCTESEKKVSIKKLIYIGESNKVQARIVDHEKKAECWDKKLQSSEVLCFSFVPIDNSDRGRVEAALIFKHKPDCNDKYVDDFPFDQTTVNSTGECKFISPLFTVNRT